MYNPTRGGNRGGRDQFSWDEVKSDKHRETYVGHSVMAPTGRWQNGRDIHWYAKAKGDDPNGANPRAAAEEELRRVKAAEHEAMLVALGLKKPSSSTDPAADDVHRTKAELARVMASMGDLEAEDSSAAGANPDATVEAADTHLPGLGSSRSARLIPQLAGRSAPTRLEGNATAASSMAPPAVPGSLSREDHSSRRRRHREDDREHGGGAGEDKKDRPRRQRRDRSRSRSREDRRRRRREERADEGHHHADGRQDDIRHESRREIQRDDRALQRDRDRDHDRDRAQERDRDRVSDREHGHDRDRRHDRSTKDRDRDSHGSEMRKSDHPLEALREAVRNSRTQSRGRGRDDDDGYRHRE
ncbi:kinase phosphorylation protein-domain-containing protein [Blastocladiella britannica]|nr:kinase phosphorylation protein-domain-containing protein [Blastocladiella britannica]